jgi:hypothetical protein
MHNRNRLEQYMRINKLQKSKSLLNNMTNLQQLSNQSPRQRLNPQQTTQNQASSSTEQIPIPFLIKVKSNQNWNSQSSLVHPQLKKNNSPTDLNALLSNSTPRILELDVNRVMISQSQIS